MNKYLLKVKELFVTSLTPAEPYDVALYLLNFYIAESSQRAHYRHHMTRFYLQSFYQPALMDFFEDKRDLVNCVKQYC